MPPSPEPAVLPVSEICLLFASMLDRLHIQHDWVTALAFLFGAAVIVPSILALLLSLGAVVASLL